MGILDPINSLFTICSHVNFDLPCLSFHCYRVLRPHYTLIPLEFSLEHVQSPNHLNQRLTIFSSIDLISQPITYIIIPDSIPYCIATKQLQHTYLRNNYLLNILSICKPTFCYIQHGRSDHDPIKIAFQLIWYAFVSIECQMLDTTSSTLL